MFGKICVVIGGGGFVGRHLLKRLLHEGGWTIRIVDLPSELRLSDSPLDEEISHALEAGRAHYISANVCDIVAVQEACRGAHVVFHMASPDPNNTNFELHRSVNVTGTQNVVAACVKEGVKKLIYTSSASVVFDGTTPIVNGDESLQYPAVPMNAYNATKAQAEKLVLEANGKNTLHTVALRPSGVFGPGDPVFLPLVVKNSNAGKLKFVIGDGQNIFDFTYVENVVHAHILAEEALGHTRPHSDEDPGGKAYFVTNGEPRLFWSFVSQFLSSLGYTPPRGNLPAKPLLVLASLVEKITTLLAPLGIPPSDFTPSRIRLVTVQRTFNCSRAAKLLGYSPPVPLEEGIIRTVEASQHLRKEVISAQSRRGRRERGVGGPTKAHTLLGGGKVADILLWRESKVSALYLSGFLVIYYLFFSSSFTLIQLVAKTLMYLTLALFTYSHVQPIVESYGYALPEIWSSWEIPEVWTAVIARHLTEKWNLYVLPPFHRLVVDRDTVYFLKLFFGLCVVEWFSSFFNTSTLIALFVLNSFFLPLLYDWFEEEVDGVAQWAIAKAKEYQAVSKEKALALYAKIESQLPKRLQRKQD